MEELGPSRHSGQGCPVVLEFVFSLSLPLPSSFILKLFLVPSSTPSHGFDAPRDTDVPRSAAAPFKMLAESVCNLQTL